MIDYISIGMRIKKNRNMLGITQEALAEEINISVPHISRIETGSAKPSLQTLVDICNALHITIDDLMRENLPAVRKNSEGKLGEVVADCSVEELDMLADVAQTILYNVRNLYHS